MLTDTSPRYEHIHDRCEYSPGAENREYRQWEPLRPRPNRAYNAISSARPLTRPGVPGQDEGQGARVLPRAMERTSGVEVGTRRKLTFASPPCPHSFRPPPPSHCRRTSPDDARNTYARAHRSKQKRGTALLLRERATKTQLQSARTLSRSEEETGTKGSVRVLDYSSVILTTVAMPWRVDRGEPGTEELAEIKREEGMQNGEGQIERYPLPHPHASSLPASSVQPVSAVGVPIFVILWGVVRVGLARGRYSVSTIFSDFHECASEQRAGGMQGRSGAPVLLRLDVI
ncbi:hypothetical protein DFH07DRAFT_971719 [Mycena maculata]|uniref:Uncharacterized protein n=1 Tax=Mycena maculata TaxID=230809 RepID=A0AAD7MLQ2_9AGAR|nr:hypothetical protein DFH07DRAFT_971719 [Mycena maculata]